MATEPNHRLIHGKGRGLIAVATGYVAGCLSLPLVLAVIRLLATPDQALKPAHTFKNFLLGVESYPLFFLIGLATALPGFLILRSILWKLDRTDLPSFIAAGAVNALIIKEIADWLIMRDTSGTWLVLAMGAVAGLATWLAERAVWSRLSQKEPN